MWIILLLILKNISIGLKVWHDDIISEEVAPRFNCLHKVVCCAQSAASIWAQDNDWLPNVPPLLISMMPPFSQCVGLRSKLQQITNWIAKCS
jgi:hypothetical protein